MKQIFDWLREQMQIKSDIIHHNWEETNDEKQFKCHTAYDDTIRMVDEAEAKWEAEHKSYDVEKVVEQIHEYFNGKIDACENDIVPQEILEYNKAICEIVRNGGVE